MIKKSIVVIGLTLLLSACGFHLRGSQMVAEPFKEMTLVSKHPFAPFEVQLKKRLRTQGVRLIPAGAKQVPTLEITSTQINRSAGALGRDKRLQEVELAIEVRAQVLAADGTVIMPIETFHHQTSATFNDGLLLGQTEEENQIKRDLRETVIDLILHRLIALNLSNPA